jgi:hypothetical protein
MILFLLYIHVSLSVTFFLGSEPDNDLERERKSTRIEHTRQGEKEDQKKVLHSCLLALPYYSWS